MISLKKTFRNEKLISLALAATFIFSSFSSVMLTSCKKGEDKAVKPADYGSYGSDLARKIAADFPDRKPYSEGEKGTGKAIGGLKVACAGKTGTAQVAGGEKDTWIIAFAPYENPTVAVAMVVERGVSGGKTVAPRVHAILAGIFGEREP